MEFKYLPLKALKRNEGQIEGLPTNPREWSKAEIERLKKSIRQTPELMEARGIIVYPHKGEYIILGGNMRYTALSEMKVEQAPCIVLPEGMAIEKLKEIVIKDNGSFGSWDYDLLANEWDELPLTDWGVPAWSVEEEVTDYEAKMKELRERLEAGEIREEDEEYQAFLAKFETAKTTDDCYTPELIYEAVAKWVEDEYGVKRDNFVRPFYPGGDYQNEKYPKGSIVVDNPPFSILAEIITFYKEQGVRFFLFAPALTLFSSSSSSSSCTCLPLNVGIIYANGANVCTSFVTNLEDEGLRLRSAPTLYNAIFEANKENMKQQKKELPKYTYPPHIITASFVGALSRYGIDFRVPVNESECVSQLDSQKESRKAIFGRGYIISDRLKAEREKAEREKAEREKAEREKAEREKAEREKAERWELSERERVIIQRLNNKLGER